MLPAAGKGHARSLLVTGIPALAYKGPRADGVDAHAQAPAKGVPTRAAGIGSMANLGQDAAGPTIRGQRRMPRRSNDAVQVRSGQVPPAPDRAGRHRRPTAADRTTTLNATFEAAAAKDPALPSANPATTPETTARRTCSCASSWTDPARRQIVTPQPQRNPPVSADKKRDRDHATSLRRRAARRGGPAIIAPVRSSQVWLREKHGPE